MIKPGPHIVNPRFSLLTDKIFSYDGKATATYIGIGPHMASHSPQDLPEEKKSLRTGHSVLSGKLFRGEETLRLQFERSQSIVVAGDYRDSTYHRFVEDLFSKYGKQSVIVERPIFNQEEADEFASTISFPEGNEVLLLEPGQMMGGNQSPYQLQQPIWSRHGVIRVLFTSNAPRMFRKYSSQKGEQKHEQ